jgi:hypothetical protein
VLTGRMECAARVLVTTLVTSAIRLSGLCQFALIEGIADHWLSQLMVVSYQQTHREIGCRTSTRGVAGLRTTNKPTMFGLSTEV